MIITEIIGDSVRTYSDRGVLIHGGFPEADYAEAVDPINAGRTYTETDIPIEQTATEEEYAEIGRIFMGVSE